MMIYLNVWNEYGLRHATEFQVGWLKGKNFDFYEFLHELVGLDIEHPVENNNEKSIQKVEMTPVHHILLLNYMNLSVSG